MASPAYQIYPNEEVATTFHLTTEEFGALQRLKMTCWTNEGLRNEQKFLARTAGIQQKKFSRMWSESLESFFQLSTDGSLWQVPGHVLQMLKQAQNREVKTKAANARWDKSDAYALHPQSTTDAQADPSALDVQCLSSSSLVSSSERERGTPTAPTLSKRATRIDPNWTPSDALTSWTMKECPGISIGRTRDIFVDYWLARAGKDATKMDWDATWKNWCRRELAPVNGHGPPPKPRPTEDEIAAKRAASEAYFRS